MKYSLGVYIVSNNQGLLDSIKAALPLSSNPALWNEQYALAQTTNMAMDNVLAGEIRFNADVNRDTALNSILDLTGIFTQCEVGSYIRLHTCFHDEIPKPCGVETLYEVIP